MIGIFEILETIILAVWLMMPAYISNPMAVVFGGGTPIDLGKNWTDGKRILGDGKTFRGLLAGTGCGIIAGLIQMQITSPFAAGEFTFTVIITMSFGALLGDMTKSFFKRRLGFERGGKMFLVDQLDFVAGAWILTYLFDKQWFIANFSLQIMVIVVILTPILHRVTNILGYYMKLKKEPW